MSDAGLNIVVGADVSNVLSGMDQVEQSFEDLQKEAFRLDNAIQHAYERGEDVSAMEASLDQLGKKMRDLNQAAASLPSAAGAVPSQSIQDLDSSLTKVSGSTRNARIQFLDLFSVMQNGKISAFALANNVSLLGPAGLAAAAGLYFLAEQLFKQSDAEKKAEADANKLKETLLGLKTAAEISGEATGSQEGNIARVTALAAAIENTNNSYAERKRALEELKETNKSYFGDLTLEASSMAILSQRVKDYSQALITEAIVKGQVDAIAKLSSELEKQVQILNQLKDAKDRAINDQKTTAIVGTGGGTGTVGGTNISQDTFLQAEVLRSNQAFEAQRDAVDKLRGSIAEYTGELNKNIQIQLTQKPLQVDKSTLDGLKSIVSVLQEVQRIYDDLGKEDKRATFKKLSDSQSGSPIVQVIEAQIDEAKKKMSDAAGDPELAGAYQKLIAALSAKLTSTENPQLHVRPDLALEDIDDKEIKKFHEDAEKYLTDYMHKLPPIKSDIKVDLTFTAFQQYQQNAKKELDKLQLQLYKDVADFSRNIQVQLASTLGKSLGDALTGKGIQTAFDSFMEFLGSSIQKLGEQLIVASGVFSAVDLAINSLLTNPALAAAAGVAAVALGEVIKNSFKARPFAVGGIVTGPTVGLIGEAGPEVVFPLDRLNQFMKGVAGSGQQNIHVTGLIRGRDLALIQARDAKLQNRT